VRSGFLSSLREAAPGFRPGGRVPFLCLPKEKEPKERAPRSPVGLGPTSLRCSDLGCRAKLTPRASLAAFKQLREVSSRSVLTHATPSPALLDGSQGPRDTFASFAGLKHSARFASRSVTVPVTIAVRAEPVEASVPRRPFDKLRANRVWAMRSEPWRIASRGWRRGAQGLRGARASALRELTSRLLSERSARRARSELGAAPQERAPERSPAAGRTATVGSPFLGYFFWRSKRSNSAAGPRPGAASRSETSPPPRRTKT
jgi:hypothetical protein